MKSPRNSYYDGTPTAPSPPPVSYVSWAIVATVAFVPTGIVAMYHAGAVNARWAMGDPAGAERASRIARRWSLVSLPLAIVFWLLIYSWAVRTGVWAAIRTAL